MYMYAYTREVTQEDMASLLVYDQLIPLLGMYFAVNG